MYSFSSASQMCEPLPRTIKGGSPPTAPNARTGEFTPPGIILAARFCKRCDCSTFREVIEGIEALVRTDVKTRPRAPACYNNLTPNKLILYSCSCHDPATSPG